MERATRIGLATEAWEAPILPLNYARVNRAVNVRDLLLYSTIFTPILQAFLSVYLLFFSVLLNLPIISFTEPTYANVP